MKVHDLVQGSPEWLAHRATHFNASDAPAMMGVSPHKTRSELLHECWVGLSKERSNYVQERILDKGHEFEALARPLAEKIIGQTLYPVTGSEGRLSASFDGLTIDDSIGFEHKSLNNDLRIALPMVGQPNSSEALPLHYCVQMEQQLMVSGAERILFVASQWSGDALAEERHCWYESDPGLRAKIKAGWDQFAIDLANYVPPEAAPVVVAEQVQALPAVMLNVSGQITVKDNFKVFETAVRDFLEHRLIRKPETDQDFADLDAQIKMLKAAEDALDASEAQMLAQIEDVDTAKKAKDMLHEMVRKNRLMAEKLLEAEKQRRREEIVKGGAEALRSHIAALNARLGVNYMPNQAADFAGAIKGKRNLDSMQDAVNTLLANSKIEANATADRITANLKAIEEANAPALFADKATLVLKAADDLAAIIANRLAAEKQRQEAERERIRLEEAAKLAREAEAAAARIKAEAEELARQEHAKRVQAVAAIKFPEPERQTPQANTEAQPPQQVLKAAPAMADATDRGLVASAGPRGGAMGMGQATAVVAIGGADIVRMQALKDDSTDPWAGCTGLITTAVLSARLGIESLRAAEIESLGFTPVKQSKPGTYWHEHQTQAIGFALAERIRKNVTTAAQKAA